MQNDMIMDVVNTTPRENGEIAETSQSTLRSVIDNSPTNYMMAEYEKPRQKVRIHKKVYRNDPCPCGKTDENGKPIKYKKCCLDSGKYEGLKDAI